MHAPICIRAFNSGIHVFCEKPMAIASKEADDMVETARKNGKKLSVGYKIDLWIMLNYCTIWL